MNTIQILTSVIVTTHSVWKESARYFLFTEIKEKVLRLLVMKVGERVSSKDSNINQFRLLTRSGAPTTKLQYLPLYKSLFEIDHDDI